MFVQKHPKLVENLDMGVSIIYGVGFYKVVCFHMGIGVIIYRGGCLHEYPIHSYDASLYLMSCRFGS